MKTMYDMDMSNIGNNNTHKHILLPIGIAITFK